MRQIVFSKKFFILTLISIAFLLFFFFIFKSTEAQVCLPMEGYLVWPGPWEPGRIPMASTSQYILVGSPLFVSGSNVGIGTLSPVYKLQVVGDISGTRLCIGSDCRSAWPGGGVAGSGSVGQVAFWTGSTSIGGDNAFFWNNTNKRLGIGTTTPQTSLHVVGNVTANTFLGTINAANVSSGQFGANTGGGNYSFPGNVGIGTMVPAYKLDVFGALRLQPSSAPSGANGVIYYDSVENKFKCFQAGSWQDCISGGFWAASGSNIYNTNTGNVGIGTTAPSVKLHVYESATNKSGALINIATISSSYYSLDVQSGGISRLYVRADGNVGIGTTAPAYRLDVVGALRLQPLITAPSGDEGVIYYDLYQLKFKCFQAGSWQDCISGGFWAASGSNIYNTNTGNVGIGTTAPVRRLHVTGSNVPNKHYSYYLTSVIEDINVGLQLIGQDETMGMAHLILTAAPTAGYNKHWIVSHMGPWGNNHFSIGYRTSSGSNFFPHELSEYLVITTNGNVGIGTTAPEAILNIPYRGSGNTIMIGSLANTGGHNFELTISMPSGATHWPFGITVGGSRVAAFDAGGNLRIDASGVSYFMGNVGIGTTAPGYKLDVAGSVHGTAWYTSSDIRFKTNIERLENVLSKLENISAYKFDWNELYQKLGRSDGRRYIGVIAQEIEKEFPELVSEWEQDGVKYKAVDYSRLTAVLLQAIKEQQRIIQEQQKEIEELKKKISN